MDLRLNDLCELKHTLQLDGTLGQVAEVVVGLLVAWVFRHVLLDLTEAEQVHVQRLEVDQVND